MKRMINISLMLILIAEMEAAGSNYPRAVPWWCLATLGPPFIEQLYICIYDAIREGDPIDVST